MVNVVTYCRVSSDEQAQKDLSIPAQRKLLHHWVEERPDFRVLKEFVDEGESAFGPADRRPGFCEMIAFCRKNPVNHILVHKLDRFSRDREESIIFKSLLRKAGVTVRSITETFESETPQGFLYEGMIEVINQFYSMNLATETLKGMKENAERGFVNGGVVPYGYRLLRSTDATGHEHGRFVLGSEDEVRVVREIFDLAANQGFGGRRIANLLNKRGIAAPRSRHWNASSVDMVLNNRVYVGDLVWFKSRRKGRDERTRTKGQEHVIAENAHEAIIDRDLFQRRKLRAGERRFEAKTAPSQPVAWLLSRLIRCEHCGGNFVGNHQKHTLSGGVVKDYRRYYCASYLQKGTSVCSSLPISAEWIEGVVFQVLRARICDPKTLEEFEDRIRRRIEARRKTYGQDSKGLEQKIAEVDRKIANYYRAIGEGMDPTICRQLVEELSVKKKAMEEESSVLRREDYYERALSLNIEELRRFASAFNEGFENLSFSVRRKTVLYFIQDISIVDRKLVRIRMKVPFDNAGIKLLADEVEIGESGTGDENEGNAAANGEIENVYMRPNRGSHSIPDW